MAELASRRAAELIQQVAGGEILAGVVDVYPRREAAQKIELSRKELLRVMGADVPDRDIEEILSALGFHPVRVDVNRGSEGSLAAVWECRAASWRRDVTRGIDLIEEVARHYGYDKFPPRLPPAKQPAHRLPHAEAQDRLRERIVGARLSGNRRDSACGSAARRALSPRRSCARRDRQSAGGRRFGDALDRNREHGARARMEPESRPAQFAPVRNRQDLRAARRRAGRDAGADAGRNRPRPRENDLRTGARIQLRGPEGRSRLASASLRAASRGDAGGPQWLTGACAARSRCRTATGPTRVLALGWAWPASLRGASRTNSSCGRTFSLPNFVSNPCSRASKRRRRRAFQAAPALPRGRTRFLARAGRWNHVRASGRDDPFARHPGTRKPSKPPIFSAAGKFPQENFR